jgi:hypothetical protein
MVPMGVAQCARGVNAGFQAGSWVSLRGGIADETVT